MKLSNSKLVLGALLCLSAATRAQTSLAQSADTQLWTDATVSTTLDQEKKTTLSLTAMSRAGDDLSRFIDYRAGVQIVRRVSSNLQLGGSYLYRQANPTPTRINHESRFTLIGLVNAPLGKRFNLVNRNLLESRDFTKSPDRIIYRNRTQINYPTRIGQTAVTPFLSGEVFYDFRDNDLSTARYSVGLGRRFSPTFGAEIYYFHQDALNGRTGDANVIGLSLRFMR